MTKDTEGELIALRYRIAELERIAMSQAKINEQLLKMVEMLAKSVSPEVVLRSYVTGKQRFR